MTDGELLDRFVVGDDPCAFESMVMRHGPMVLRACRDILGNAHDAEDAFQAVFLVLARNARTIRGRESLGRWLYGVAYRISVRAKVQARRRTYHEIQGAKMAAVDPRDDLPSEYPALLHHELNRLPEKLRGPLVLCYLEGQSYEQAAQLLRCPLGTLKSRLTKGREVLRSRLTRRGVTASLVLLILATLEEGASASVPEELVESTVEAASQAAAESLVTAGASSKALRLAATEKPARLGPVFWVAALLLLGLGMGAAGVSARTMMSGAAASSVSIPVLIPGPPASCH
jgi:RNA polymerase sigma factor (sigma-70 family)